MNTLHKLLLGSALGFATLVPLAGVAYAMPNMQMPHSEAAVLTEGEVRKLDVANGKITIKHGPIAHMDMPGMTMAFTVGDKALLGKVKVGDKIRFSVRHEGGKMLVTDIRPEQ